MADVLGKDVSIGSYTVSLENVTAIFEALSKVVAEQADIELARWVRLPDQNDPDFEAAKRDARERAYRVTASVRFADGTTSFGSSPELFRKAPQGPQIAMVYMTNTSAFMAAANVEPRNKFNLWLDFSQPPLLDATTVISGPTPNGTALKIEGDRAGWVAGVERAIIDRLDKRHNFRRLLHGHFVYDYGLLIFGAPFALYLCWLAQPYIQTSVAAAPILQAGMYIYLFMSGLWVYRIMFSYLRWAYPLAELSEQLSRPKKHRLFWWGIVISLSGKIFWDIAGPLIRLPSASLF